MIYELHSGTPDNVLDDLRQIEGAYLTSVNGHHLVLTHGSTPLPYLEKYENHISRTVETVPDIQLSSKAYHPNKRAIKIGELTIGGDTNNTLVIGGPCAVESEAQIMEAAAYMKKVGINVFRAGAFKPRTSPYTFQGLGAEGLRLLEAVREKYGLKIITEVKDSTHFDQVAETADIVQVGAKAMYDQAVLRACGQIRKPVLLKRHFGATIQEWVQAAEFILLGGNQEVMLCERGIRTFENKTRFTMDITGVAWIQHHTNLPIIMDPSHALGATYGIKSLAKASLAMGADGLLIESHPNPKVAKSDAKQQLPLETFGSMMEELRNIAPALGRTLV